MPDAAAAEPETRSLKVLIADDQETLREVYVHMLHQMGHTAEAVENGAQLIDALERESYDVVLTDLEMPVMDGLEAARRICRRWAPAERPFIVALTGTNSAHARARWEAAGVEAAILKPVDAEALGRILEDDNLDDHLERMRHAAAGGEGDPGPLDSVALDRLLEDLGGDLSVLRAMIERFLEESRAGVGRLRDALEADDAMLVAKAAHGLKSSAATMGARQLARICSRLETWGRSGNVPDGRRHSAELAQEHIRVRAALQARLRQQPSAPGK